MQINTNTEISEYKKKNSINHNVYKNLFHGILQK